MEYIVVTNWEKHQSISSRGRPSLSWCKLSSNTPNDFKFGRLPDHAQLLFLQLLCLATKFSNEIPFDKKWLSKQLAMHSDIDMQPLIDNGMVQIIDGKDTVYSRCTHGEDTVKFTPLSISLNKKESNKTNKKEKNKQKRKTPRKISAYWNDIGLQDLYREYLEVRKKKKYPITPRIENRLEEKHKQFTEDGGDAEEILNQAIMGGWRDFFPPKGNHHGNHSKGSSSSRQTDRKLTPVQRQQRAAERFFAQLEEKHGDILAEDDSTL